MASTDTDAAVTGTRVELRAGDRQRIVVHAWQPRSKPVAVVQVLHGLGEHAGRYERFGQAGAAAGMVVAAHNHRGHGPDCAREDLGHYADVEGWEKVIADALLVRQELLQRYAGIPLILLGHSMGSYIAQCSLMRQPQGVTALILSATNFPPRLQVRIGRMAASLEMLRAGRRARSKLLDKMSFAKFNRRFAPNRTEFDWLSRDEVEVDKYIADPLCGGMFTNKLWHDLTGGLLEITTQESLRKVAATLPILVLGGEHDPAGGRKGLNLIAGQYRSTGHTDVTLRIYDSGRHEMLNETNRDEVTRDIVEWIASRMGRRVSQTENQV